MFVCGEPVLMGSTVQLRPRYSAKAKPEHHGREFCASFIEKSNRTLVDWEVGLAQEFLALSLAPCGD